MKNYLSTFIHSGRTGWVCCYGSQADLEKNYNALTAAGITAEKRHAKGAYNEYWLVVGIPSSELDDIVMPLMQQGKFSPSDSSFPTYASVASQSSLI